MHLLDKKYLNFVFNQGCLIIKKRYKKTELILVLLLFLILIIIIFIRIRVLESIFSFNKSKNFLKKEKEISFYALSPNFHSRLNLACGKVNNENKIFVAPQNYPIIKIFDQSGKIFKKFKIDNERVGETFDLVVGDVVGDKKNELVLGKIDNNSKIYIYNNLEKKKSKPLISFFAFDNLPIGVNLVLGDVNGDDKSEIILGAGNGGGPQIKIFNGQGKEIGNFFAFHPKLRSGVRVAVVDYDDDGKDEIVALSNLVDDTQLKIYKFNQFFSLENIVRIYGNKIKIPTKIYSVHLEDNKISEIITVPEKKFGEKINIFRNGEKISPAILGKTIDLEGGVNLAFCQLDKNKKDDIIVNEKGTKIKIFYR